MKGIINVLKPPHMTSHDVVGFIRRQLHTKKVGHTGTLDPMAAGVLPICIGHATKISGYLLKDIKKYRCQMTLGANTDTQDAFGKVIKESKVEVSKEEILEAFKAFKGHIKQIPPMYSALKHKGKKLYELAREGKEVQRKARDIQIYDLSILHIENKNIVFDVTCSKGTYVRTLCEDIGNRLGCGAYMSFLLRTQSGMFKLEDTITIEKIQELSKEELQKKYLFSMDAPLYNMTRIDVKKECKKYLMNGNDLFKKNIIQNQLLKDETVRLYVEDEFMALGTVRLNEQLYIDIDRVFY